MSDHVHFSRKLRVIFRRALIDSLEDDLVFNDFIDAYELQSRSYTGEGFGCIESPRDWFQRLVMDEAEVETANNRMHQIANALIADGMSPAPIVFPEQYVTWPEHRPTLPPALGPFLRQLELEGYVVQGGSIVPIDAEAPGEAADQNRLLQTLKALPEPGDACSARPTIGLSGVARRLAPGGWGGSCIP